jgi:HlyD family secretion protein
MDRELSAQKKRRKKQKKWLTYGALILLFLILFFGIRIILRPTFRLDEIKLAEVETGNFRATISASGNVQPEFEEIRTSPIASSIRSIRCNLGDDVNRGDTILALDTRGTEAELANMLDELALKKNNVEKLKLQLEKSLIDLKTEYRVKELQKDRMSIELEEEVYLDSIGGGSREKIENARLNLKIAELELAQIRQTIQNSERSMQADLTGLNYEISIQQKQVRELENTLSRCTVLADREGVVTSIVNQIGLPVLPGDQLVKIANLDSYMVTGVISDLYATSLRTGSIVLISLSNREKISGEVVSISPAVSNNTVQFRVRLDQRDHPLLRPNLKVDLYVVKSEKDSVLLVANGPFYKGGAVQNVFMAGNNSLHRKEVRFGESNMDYVEVLEGLAPGDRIVTTDLSEYERYEVIKLK